MNTITKTAALLLAATLAAAGCGGGDYEADDQVAADKPGSEPEPGRKAGAAVCMVKQTPPGTDPYPLPSVCTPSKK